MQFFAAMCRDIRFDHAYTLLTMQQIILIGGKSGSGKSTCGKLLYEALEHSALIESDALIKVNPWTVDEKFMRLKLKNATNVIRNYWNAGYAHILCPGLVWNQQELATLLSFIPEYEKQIVLFWLETRKVERNRRRLKRGRDDADLKQHLDMVDEVTKASIPTSLASGHIITIITDEKTPEMILPVLLKLLHHTEHAFNLPFWRDNNKLWALEAPTEEMSIDEFGWILDVPFWEDEEGYIVLTPREVLQNLDRFPRHREQIAHCDTSYPLDIMKNKHGKWLILDGLHRLVKLVMENKRIIRVRKIPPELVHLTAREDTNS